MGSGKTEKIATTIASPVLFSKEGTIEKVISMTKEAANGGARLIVFPETFVPGYPWWIWMGINNNKKLELFKRQFENSLEIRSSEMDYIRNTAKKNEIMIALGFVEKDGSTLYNSQTLIDESGNMVINRRKLMPTGEERTIWGMGDATSLRVCDTSLGKIGMLICYEHSMPLSRYALYSLGEQIHIAMWPGANFRSQPRDRKKIIDIAMRNMTFEGQVYTVYSSSCVGEEELKFYLDLDPNNQGILDEGGGISGIVDPISNYVAGPIEDKEQIIYAEINLDAIVGVKHMIDCVGHYARPDIFQLNVFSRKHQPVKFVHSFEASVEKEAIVESKNETECASVEE
ncbi:MAG: Aliphatic nitrilase [Syntrophorhabdus sp. PtaB.Bin006]|nr:MAG: Aliphatic nitrilase [Syntrophorhabdus sp. PtaB.Bin006]